MAEIPVRGAARMWARLKEHPLAFPLMAAIQSMCALIGRVTGKGLAANIKSAFSPAVLRGVVLLLPMGAALGVVYRTIAA